MAIVLRVEDPYARFFVPLQQAFTSGVMTGLENYLALQKWQEQQDYLARQREQEKAKLMELLSGLDFGVAPENVQVMGAPTFKAPEVSGLFQDRIKSAPWQSLFNAPAKPPKEEPPPQPATFVETPKSPSELYAELIERNKPVIAGALAYGINLFPYVREMAENVQREAQQAQAQERINRYLSVAVKRNPFVDDASLEYYRNLMAIDLKTGVKAIQEDINYAKTAQGIAGRLNADPQDIYSALRSGMKVDDVMKLYNQGYQVKNVGGAIMLVDALGNVVTDDERNPKVVGYTPEHELAIKKHELDEWYKREQIAIDKARLAMQRQEAKSKSGKEDPRNTFKMLNELRQAMKLITDKYGFPTAIDPTQANRKLDMMSPEDKQYYIELYNAYRNILNRFVSPQSQTKPQASQPAKPQAQQPQQTQQPQRNPFKELLGK